MTKKEGSSRPTKSKIMNNVIRIKENQSESQLVGPLLLSYSLLKEKRSLSSPRYGFIIVATPGKRDKVTKNTSHTVRD